MAEETLEFCLKMYPGFSITCLKCKSQRIAVENTVGFSALSGGWGSVDLRCLDCDHYVELFEA